MSENYIGFHSFLLGAETKVLIELKDIQELKKERSKGIFDDSLRIVTKDKEEVSNLVFILRIYLYIKPRSIIYPTCLKETKYTIY